MNDREKVIKGLEETKTLFETLKTMFQVGFPNIVSDVYDDALDAVSGALALLKAQEPVVPKRELRGASGFRYFCGACGVSIEPNHKYCCICGRAVKWE